MFRVLEFRVPSSAFWEQQAEPGTWNSELKNQELGTWNPEPYLGSLRPQRFCRLNPQALSRGYVRSDNADEHHDPRDGRRHDRQSPSQRSGLDGRGDDHRAERAKDDSEADLRGHP